jgi:putative glutathione S-transferase
MLSPREARVGQLIDGVWSREDLRIRNTDGSFARPESPWRRWVSADGSSGFRAEPGRYHLYVNVGCPWAYRTVLFRKLKGLEAAISMSCTHPAMGPEGWTFLDEEGRSIDAFSGLAHVHEVYTRADPKFTGRVTVPILWDAQTETIVSNESSEIIRMLNSEFDAWGREDLDFYPEPLRAQIDAINEVVYANVNNGVYRCGFAGTQEAYERAYDALFATLDELEARLARQRYLVNDTLTEADWRLLSTLLRFDLAYYGLFRCNRHRLVDFENLWAYARDLYQYPGVAETIDFDAFKTIYWSRTGLIPKGPDVDWTEPPDRA